MSVQSRAELGDLQGFSPAWVRRLHDILTLKEVDFLWVIMPALSRENFWHTPLVLVGVGREPFMRGMNCARSVWMPELESKPSSLEFGRSLHCFWGAASEIPLRTCCRKHARLGIRGRFFSKSKFGTKKANTTLPLWSNSLSLCSLTSYLASPHHDYLILATLAVEEQRQKHAPKVTCRLRSYITEYLHCSQQ